MVLEFLEGLVAFFVPAESFLQQAKKGATLIYGPRNESIKRGDPPSQTLHFFCVPRSLHVEYGLHLLGIRLYPPLRHHKSDELSDRHLKGTFVGVKLHQVLPQGLKSLTQILEVAQLKGFLLVYRPRTRHSFPYINAIAITDVLLVWKKIRCKQIS